VGFSPPAVRRGAPGVVLGSDTGEPLLLGLTSSLADRHPGSGWHRPFAALGIRHFEAIRFGPAGVAVLHGAVIGGVARAAAACQHPASPGPLAFDALPRAARIFSAAELVRILAP